MNLTLQDRLVKALRLAGVSSMHDGNAFAPKFMEDLHYKRVSYLIEPTAETLNFGRRKVRIHEWEDGRVEIHCDGRKLPYSPLDQHPHVDPGGGGKQTSPSVPRSLRRRTGRASKEAKHQEQRSEA
jgi:hypothetical protein